MVYHHNDWRFCRHNWLHDPTEAQQIMTALFRHEKLPNVVEASEQ